MGMITRVRGRMRSFSITKLDPGDREEKIAETVCLLSILFLLPYCCKGHAPLILSLGGWCLATYSLFVLPILISANYRYPVWWLRHLASKLPGIFEKISGPVWRLTCKVYAPIDRCERAFMKMTNLSNMATQLVFFMMCDRVLLCGPSGPKCPQKRVTGLYSLMFYNVITYCVSYIKELIEKEDWSVTVNMTQHSKLKHVAMSATKIVLEWTKAITFIITVTFMLLVFGLEQGLEHYQPTTLYTFVTWTYYMCTERAFYELFPPLLVFLRMRSTEALEYLYAPVILRYYTLSLAAVVVATLVCYGQIKFAVAVFYLTVYLRGRDAVLGCVKKLRVEKSVLDRFRRATRDEIENCDDVCAVCLSRMDSARVTPCQHMFHALCLRQCLNASDLCPMCKREYVFY